MAIRLQKIWDFTPVKKSSHGYDVVAKNFQAADQILAGFCRIFLMIKRCWLKTG